MTNFLKKLGKIKKLEELRIDVNNNPPKTVTDLKEFLVNFLKLTDDIDDYTQEEIELLAEKKAWDLIEAIRS